MEQVERSGKIGGFLSESKAALYLLTAVYIALGLGFIHTGEAINNEGLLVHLWARMVPENPWPVLFFQKAKPVITLLYLPVAMFGERLHMVFHLLISALTLPLLAAVGRELGLRRANLAALLVAMSPVFLMGGAAILSNLDGILGTTLFLYLALVKRRNFAAGLILGMLPWVRHELALFSAMFFFWGLVDRRGLRFVLGTAFFPVLYSIAGAFYHGNLLWILQFPPTTLQPMPDNPVWLGVDADGLIHALVAITPAMGLALSFRLRSLSRVEKWLLAYVVIWLFLSTVLPITRVANFGFAPRYPLQTLPMLALLVLRSVNAWERRDFPILPSIFGLTALLALHFAAEFRESALVLPVLLLTGLSVALAWRNRSHLALICASLLIITGPLLEVRAQVSRSELASFLPEASTWIRANVLLDFDREPGQRSPPIYTNSSVLSTWLDGPAKLPGLDLRYMIGKDQYYDLVTMSNPDNGQREALYELVQGWFYGKGVPPPEISPDRLPEGALFVLRDDRRLPLLLPPETWAPHLHTLHQGERFLIAELRPLKESEKDSGTGTEVLADELEPKFPAPGSESVNKL